MANECQGDFEYDPSDHEEDGLKGMESDEALLVEWLQHQKNNRRNDGYIGQRASHVIGESGGCGCDCARAWSCATSTLRTCCSIRDLRSTVCTKSHSGLLMMSTRGTLSEPLPGRNDGGPCGLEVCRFSRPYLRRAHSGRFGPLEFLIETSLVIVSRRLNSLVYCPDSPEWFGTGLPVRARGGATERQLHGPYHNSLSPAFVAAHACIRRFLPDMCRGIHE